MTAYPPTIEEWLGVYWHYPNKTTHQRNGKKVDKKKGDDPKSEDKDSNTDGIVGTHVEDTATPEESTAPIGGASIGAQVLETNK